FNASGKGVIICLYVDDILIFGTDQDQVNKTKEFLSSNFDMKDLGGGGTLVSQLEYSRAIGCLMYAMISTRPDIAFAVRKLSSGYPSVIEDYFDASWINKMEDHSSTSGWVFLFGGGVISWALKKQTCITSSTMESEFMALAAAANEALTAIHDLVIHQMDMKTAFLNGDLDEEIYMKQPERFYVIEPNNYVSVNSIIESRDAIFDEERFMSIPRPRGMIQPSSSKIAEDDVEGTRDKTLSQCEYCFIIEEDPRTLREAMASRDVA
nr:hypothetical protein [Tanacetum cinerariifolium]